MSKELQKAASEKKQHTFGEVFETAVDGIARNEYEFTKHMLAELKEKREFGAKKYGDTSFQASLSNFLNTPCLQHADEELTDCLNYLLATAYQWRISGEVPDASADSDEIHTLLNEICHIKEEIQKLMYYRGEVCKHANLIEEKSGLKIRWAARIVRLHVGILSVKETAHTVERKKNEPRHYYESYRKICTVIQRRNGFIYHFSTRKVRYNSLYQFAK